MKVFEKKKKHRILRADDDTVSYLYAIGDDFSLGF